MPPAAHAEKPKTALTCDDALKAAQTEIKRLSRYLDREGDKAAPTNITERYLRCRELCDKIIFQDFQYANKHDVEAELWDVHVTINAWFRKRIDKLKEGKPKEKKHVEGRKVSKKFLEFIKSSQHYYRSFIQRLAEKFGAIPELKAVALKLHLESPSVETAKDTASEWREKVLLSCCMTVSRLGDLSRWREEKRVSGEPEWAHAIGFYDLAGYLRPQSGRPHHQRAVIARACHESNLKVLYWFLRALVCFEPFPAALNNLELFYEKNLKASKHKQPASSGSLEGALDAAVLAEKFVFLHSKLHQDFMQEQVEKLEKGFITGLLLSSKGSAVPSANTYKKITLVNLAAEALAAMQAEKNPSNAKLHPRRLRLLSLNAKSFTALLKSIHGGLRKLVQEGECEDGDTKRLSDKIPATLRRLLPSLRLYSSWLVYSMPVFNSTFGENSFFESVKSSIKVLWQTFADTWTLLVNVFNIQELIKLPNIDYLLEEDEETLGFLPFQENSDAIHRFHDMRTKLRKPGTNIDGIERHHPNLEMLGRVRDIVADGGRIAEDDTTPLSLVNDEESGLSITYDDCPLSLPSTPSQSHVPPCFSSNNDGDAGSAFAPDETEYPGASAVNDMVDGLLAEEVMVIDQKVDDCVWGTLPPSGRRTPPSHTFEDPLDIDPFYGAE